MNKQKYDSLSDENKAAIDSMSGADFSAIAGRDMAGADVPSRAAAAANGNNIITKG